MTRHLLHTGWAKAGSTFLQEWFARHPQLRYVPHSFAGFRNVFQLADVAQETPAPGYRYYVTSSELLGSGGNVPYGNALYSFRMSADRDLRAGQRRVCSMLREIFPDSKVLIVTRGFSGIIRSLYSQYVALGGELEFLEYLEAYTAILEQWLDVDYNLGLYREAFGHENVLVLPFELLKNDTPAFISTVEDFLDVDHFDVVPGVRNPALGADRLYWYSRLSRYLVSPVAELFGPARARRLYSLYSFKIVRPDRLGFAVRLLNAVSSRSTNMDFPDGYLERFRGVANTLSESELHRPFLDQYLVESVPLVENTRAGSIAGSQL
jgi:hypothetical protein